MRLGWARTLVRHKRFDHVSVAVILSNAVLMGIELNHGAYWTHVAQEVVTTLYVIEVALRYLGRASTKEYLGDNWNYFDLIVVGASLLPEALFSGADVAVLRTFRVFRLFRVLRNIEELSMITAVLLRSIRSLGYSGVLFFVFLYVYAVMGVTLFKQDDYASSVNASLNPSNPDPYGTLGEAMFSLFRVMTGEDWTDLRYNLLSKDGASAEWDVLVTLYHVSWMIVSAFLLLNLVVGAIVNNYDRMISEVKEAEAQKTRETDTARTEET